MTNDTALIAVDIGNSTVKLGWFAAGCGDAVPQPKWVREVGADRVASGELFENLPSDACRWCVVSVYRQAQQELADWVQQCRPPDEYCLLTWRDLPLAVEVDFPDRVGADRLAAAVAANRLRRADRPAIVIDVGTAITVDLVAASGAFLGGAILPGFQLTSRALAEGTDLLPLLPPDPAGQLPAVVGKTTEGAIRSGLFWGTVGAVRELVDRMSGLQQSAPEVFVTGGQARNLADHLQGETHFVPHLVLAGIALAGQGNQQGPAKT